MGFLLSGFSFAYIQSKSQPLPYTACCFFSLSRFSHQMGAPLSICPPNKNLVITINSSYSSNPPPTVNPRSCSFGLTFSLSKAQRPSNWLPFWGVSPRSKAPMSARWSLNTTINAFNEHSFAKRSNSLGLNISQPDMASPSLHSTSPTPKVTLSKKSCYASFTVRKWQS